jgi:hypothetical protein
LFKGAVRFVASELRVPGYFVVPNVQDADFILYRNPARKDAGVVCSKSSVLGKRRKLR